MRQGPMTSARGNSKTIRFGTFELDLSAEELRKHGVKVRLQEQPLRVLQILLESPGRLVSREELRTAIWPSNSYVDFDQGLNRAINKLREALGDSADNPRFIETLARRGYRFLSTVAADATGIRSLLVLPLENLPNEPEQEYFSEGLTEALTTSLAKISALQVISRTTATVYKRSLKPVPVIARELGIDAVVEGSVLRSEGQVRISVQLVRASTDTHVWAESYERDMRNILALQSEVANAIAKEIQVRLTPGEQAQLGHTPIVDPDAYDAYLRGRYYSDKRTPATIAQAIDSFEEALGRDPGLAVARAGLADAFGALGWWSYVPPANGLAKAKALALRTLETAPNLAEAHSALAWALKYYDYDFVAAEREFRRAIELDPNYSVPRYRLAMTLAHLGRFEEAIAEGARAVRLDPLAYTVHGAMCWVYMFARRHHEHLVHGKRAVELHPEAPHMRWALGAGYLEAGDFEAAIAQMRAGAQLADAPLFRALLAETYAVTGRRDEAQTILQHLQARSGEEYLTPYMFARIHTALGDRDEAFRWLNIAYQERAPWMVLLKRDPRMDSLRADSRYETLLRLMNFPS